MHSPISRETDISGRQWSIRSPGRKDIDMKKNLVVMAAALLMPLMLSAQNRQYYGPFYTSEEAPRLEKILPPPPSLTDNRFSDDWEKYNWGKSIRETERGIQAVKDAAISARFFMERFSPVLSHPVNPQDYPVLYELFSKAHSTESQAGRSAKAYFARVRPYQQFHEATSVPQSEKPTDYTSYPSGHTHAGWLMGMILTSLDPDHTEDIMKVAYELGQSRVIVGFHYQSDVDAGRVAASITFARLCAMPEFREMLEKAREEYWRK